MARIREAGCKFIHCHTSGHIRRADIQSFIESVEAAIIVPVHTTRPDLLATLISNAELLQNGETIRI
jgi:mRNA degradation ribonuclease J1/J2